MEEKKETLKDSCKNRTLDSFLKNRNHKNYKFYSTDKRIEAIAKNKIIYLSDGRNWNDVRDRRNFNNISLSVKNFGMCFSFSVSENIALWMLYGGTKKNGAMINFSKSMLSFTEEKPKIKLGRFYNNEFEEIKEISSKDYEINFYDVLYYGKKKPDDTTYSIKHSAENCNYVDEESFTNITILKKDYAWSYENECRLVISIAKDLIQDDRIDTVQLALSCKDDLTQRIILAPNYKGAQKYNKSRFSSELDWDICDKCDKICNFFECEYHTKQKQGGGE